MIIGIAEFGKNARVGWDYEVDSRQHSKRLSLQFSVRPFLSLGHRNAKTV